MDSMKYDITRLKNGLDKEILIKIDKTFSKQELRETPFIELNNIEIIGSITKDSLENYILNCTITGEMLLPCAVTLNPVSYSFNTSVEGNIEELLEEIGEIDKKIENTIDIFPIIWENILVEIPSRVVSKDVSSLTLKGEGWRLCTEKQSEDINPEFQKLRDLFNEK